MTLREIQHEIEEILVKSGLDSFHTEVTTDEGRITISAGPIGLEAYADKEV